MTTKRERMMEQIEKHAADLARIFPNAQKRGIPLCKALHRLEMQGHKYAEDLCNIPDSQNDALQEAILEKVVSLLGKNAPIEFNLDPRGYAFKIPSEWVKRFDLQIHQDMGGYGILCPEFTGEE